MFICLLVDRARFSKWHAWLSADLVAAGHQVDIRAAERTTPWPLGLASALRLGRPVHRLRGAHAIDPMPSRDLCTLAETSSYDLVLDCSGSPGMKFDAGRTLSVLFCGEPTELAVMAAVRGDGPVEIVLRDESNGRILAMARPAFLRCSLTEALDSILSRAVELIVTCIARTDATVGLCRYRQSSPMPWRNSIVADLFRQHASVLAGKAGRKLSLKRQARWAKRWAIAIRQLHGPGLIQGDWPGRAHFSVVPDDGLRFYADPMLVEHEGRTWLFCEEFPFATERGIISVAEVHEDGSVGQFRPVLERPYHLSYPFVFGDGGQFWMIPESAESGAVELYRAVDFPFSWILERNLIEGLAAFDATLLCLDGRAHLLLTTGYRLSTSWDSLRLYEAVSFEGPYSPQLTGVAIIDSTQSRSAGALLRRGDDLIRPVQDCSRLYGGSLRLVRVDQLSADTFGQTEVANIRVVDNDSIVGTHTYSLSPRYEAVDVWGSVDGVRTVALTVEPHAPPA